MDRTGGRGVNLLLLRRRLCRRLCLGCLDAPFTALLLAAWRTGLTLEHVLLRLDAFEHLQLPVELLHGSIGRIQAQARGCTRAMGAQKAAASHLLG